MCIFGLDVEHGFSVYGVQYTTLRQYVLCQKAAFFGRLDVWKRARSGEVEEVDWYDADVEAWEKVVPQYLEAALKSIYRNKKMMDILKSTSGHMAYAGVDKVLSIGISKIHAQFMGKRLGQNIYGKCLEKIRDTYSPES